MWTCRTSWMPESRAPPQASGPTRSSVAPSPRDTGEGALSSERPQSRQEDLGYSPGQPRVQGSPCVSGRAWCRAGAGSPGWAWPWRTRGQPRASLGNRPHLGKRAAERCTGRAQACKEVRKAVGTQGAAALGWGTATEASVAHTVSGAQGPQTEGRGQASAPLCQIIAAMGCHPPAEGRDNLGRRGSQWPKAGSTAVSRQCQGLGGGRWGPTRGSSWGTAASPRAGDGAKPSRPGRPIYMGRETGCQDHRSP